MAAILDSSEALPRPAFAAAGDALSAVSIRSGREGSRGPAAQGIFALPACSSRPTSRAAHGCLGNIVRKNLARLLCDLFLFSHRSDSSMLGSASQIRSVMPTKDAGINMTSAVNRESWKGCSETDATGLASTKSNSTSPPERTTDSSPAVHCWGKALKNL